MSGYISLHLLLQLTQFIQSALSVITDCQRLLYLHFQLTMI
jgi:hypothetical protein